MARTAAVGALLRDPAFQRLWLGLSISYLGDQFTIITLLWFVLQLTGSGRAVGLVILCFDLPGVVAEAAAPAAAAPETPLPQLLAKAEATKGQADAKACEACHSFAKGGPAKIGPPLYGVVGRPIASVAGFSYSDGLKALGGDWTYEELNKWITKPSALVSGTKMSYPGDAHENQRADILAYLQTLSDSPVPFPK